MKVGLDVVFTLFLIAMGVYFVAAGMQYLYCSKVKWPKMVRETEAKKKAELESLKKEADDTVEIQIVSQETLADKRTKTMRSKA